MVYTRNWISFTEKASFLHFWFKTSFNPCEDKTFLAILWLSQQLLSFLLVSVTTLHRQKTAFHRNFNIGLIGSCLHSLPYNKVRANAGVARTNNRDKNQNWMVFRFEVSGANTNNRNSVA